ncbi:MAG: phosphoribosylformylglycinamidine cyclo-ligase [Melioribacteraceae bacterium]|nr:phosphoribosylformylglycinamidine cyclo-ligase [Melioribacteraceae bacterium]
MSESYKSAGVDIEAGEETVDRIKNHVKSTFNKNVLADIGHFGAFFEIDKGKYDNPVLVSSVDGVGTKLKIGFMMNKHDTVGRDLVNHCVNDIAVCGANPLYFMDYLAFGRLVPEKAEQIIKGFAIACRENDVALIGGETAEMPGLYDDNEYDMSGTIVGIVEKKNILDGSKVSKGNVLLGLPSTGLHTNGYSLARKVLLDKYNLTDKPVGLNASLGEVLLNVHKSYLMAIRNLIDRIDVKAFSHITGGGIIGNTKRIVPDGLNLKIDWKSWEVPPIFNLIQSAGNITDDEMRKAFNMGIGLIAVIDANDIAAAEKVLAELGEESLVIGSVE